MYVMISFMCEGRNLYIYIMIQATDISAIYISTGKSNILTNY
jgi:hypothetical protein